MADINEIRDKVFSKIGAMADVTKDAAAKTADRAKNMARIAKLSVDITGEKDTIKKAYAEIGKLYYESHRNDPEGIFAQLCEEVTLSVDSISMKEAQIAEIKESFSDKDSEIEVEFEEVVAKAEEKVAEAAGTVKEGVSEVVETVTDACDCDDESCSCCDCSGDE